MNKDTYESLKTDDVLIATSFSSMGYGPMRWLEGRTYKILRMEEVNRGSGVLLPVIECNLVNTKEKGSFPLFYPDYVGFELFYPDMSDLISEESLEGKYITLDGLIIDGNGFITYNNKSVGSIQLCNDYLSFMIYPKTNSCVNYNETEHVIAAHVEVNNPKYSK